VTQLDVPASNGYIHHIDGLLAPDSLQPLLPRRCDVTSQRTVRVCVQYCSLFSLNNSVASLCLYNHALCDTANTLSEFTCLITSATSWRGNVFIPDCLSFC